MVVILSRIIILEFHALDTFFTISYFYISILLNDLIYELFLVFFFDWLFKALLLVGWLIETPQLIMERYLLQELIHDLVGVYWLLANRIV